MSAYDDLLRDNLKAATQAMSARLRPARTDAPPANLPPPSSAPDKDAPK